MSLEIAVDEILARVPERARSAYTNLVTHAESRYDEATGWSCAYLTQQDLADEMHVCLRTATRAVSDLRRMGLVRVLAWPGAKTETQVRVGSVPVASVFGPVRLAQENMPHHQLVDCAIRILVKENRELEGELFGSE
jgi:DNA-binding transcriptional regulator LsrR (DeoR family)